MAFEKNWRERKIIHRTPGGKMTRVKIGSLPAPEQQKYNPNRYKKDGPATSGGDGYNALLKRDVDVGHIFDFYVQVDSVSDLDELKEDELILATSDSYKVEEMFDTDKKVLKLKSVPMDAVSKVLVVPEDGEIDYDDIDTLEFEDISELEGDEKYEKIKFNTEEMYQLDISDFLKYIEIVVDRDTDHEINEQTKSFYNYYYVGDKYEYIKK